MGTQSTCPLISPFKKNFVHIRAGKNRLSETAAAPKVGVETIGRMPSVGSCESWRVSVPGGSRISSMDPLGLSFAIPCFPVADRSGLVPSVILEGLSALPELFKSLVLALE